MPTLELVRFSPVNMLKNFCCLNCYFLNRPILDHQFILYFAKARSWDKKVLKCALEGDHGGPPPVLPTGPENRLQQNDANGNIEENLTTRRLVT